MKRKFLSVAFFAVIAFGVSFGYIKHQNDRPKLSSLTMENIEALTRGETVLGGCVVAPDNDCFFHGHVYEESKQAYYEKD